MISTSFAPSLVTSGLYSNKRPLDTSQLSTQDLSSRPVGALSSPSKPRFDSQQLSLQTPSSPQVNSQSNEPDNGDVAQAEARVEKQLQDQQLQREQRIISDLAARDREVRAHEQAHAAVGGQYAGAPSYQYERGPDGVNYAVGGEVRIDVSRAATPEATILKAQTVRRAALAPAEPSPQDRNVAAKATQLESSARAELNAERIEQAQDSEPDDPLAEASVDTNANNTGGAAGQEASGSSLDRDEANVEERSRISSRNGSLLSQVISNTAINPAQPGDILSQIA